METKKYKLDIRLIGRETTIRIEHNVSITQSIDNYLFGELNDSVKFCNLQGLWLNKKKIVKISSQEVK